MSDTTNLPPKLPKPDQGSGVCLTPESPDTSEAKTDPEQAKDDKKK
jgi:hypothetical protein